MKCPCVIRYFLIFLGLSRVMNALPLAEYSNILVDFELVMSLFENIQMGMSYKEAHNKFFGLRGALLRCQRALYGKDMMRAHCGQLKHAVPHFDWLLTQYQRATCDPWAKGVKFEFLKEGSLKKMLLETQMNKELYHSADLKCELEAAIKIAKSPYSKKAEPTDHNVLRNGLFAGVLGGMIKKVEDLVAKKLQDQFGGELLTYEQIKMNYSCKGLLYKKIETLHQAKLTFSSIPLLQFAKKPTGNTQEMETEGS